MGRKKLNPKRHQPPHPADCACRGTGFLYPTHPGDNTRPRLVPCNGPGVQTSAVIAQLPPPKAAARPEVIGLPEVDKNAIQAPPAPPPPDLFDNRRRAAGEKED